MPKISRILRLLSLLSRRDSVTLDDIKDVCGIPERTAYRYLNTLSEAGVPLYFDRDMRAYRLANPPGILARTLTDTEVLVMVSSLVLISRHLNTQYQGALESVISKIGSQCSIRATEISKALASESFSNVTLPDYSQYVTLAIVQMAVAHRKPLMLAKGADSGALETISIRDPGLTFDKGWQIRGQSDSGPERVQINTVVHASTNIQGSSKRLSG